VKVIWSGAFGTIDCLPALKSVFAAFPIQREVSPDISPRSFIGKSLHLH
jgi:hypothetical protein